MLTLFRSAALLTLLSLSLNTPASAAPLPTGAFAEQQMRHIATYFPGRMAGSPADMLTADYLQQQFSQLGYQSNVRRFNTRYAYRHEDGRESWHNVSASSVIAARAGKVPQQIVIIAHSDSWTPQSESDTRQNLGGLSSQAADDNASGLGVMLELARELSKTEQHYSLRFVALSGEQIGQLGSTDYLARMKPDEQQNTLLVIDINSLIVGGQLSFRSGNSTPQAVARQTRDRALALARRAGIRAEKHTAREPASSPFDRAGLPLLQVSASDGPPATLPKVVRQHFPPALRHQAQRDNLNYIDRWLPGRITRRTHDSVAVLLPLIRELANP